jgi:hypothetical protein
VPARQRADPQPIDWSAMAFAVDLKTLARN